MENNTRHGPQNLFVDGQATPVEQSWDTRLGLSPPQQRMQRSRSRPCSSRFACVMLPFSVGEPPRSQRGARGRLSPDASPRPLPVLIRRRSLVFIFSLDVSLGFDVHASVDARSREVSRR
ncbi:hypothetical protein MRX96_013036 [Rhipicephalus microplus]